MTFQRLIEEVSGDVYQTVWNKLTLRDQDTFDRFILLAKRLNGIMMTIHQEGTLTGC